MPTTASPPLVLFTGTNYLRRLTNDAALSGGTDISVAVTFDPNLVSAATSGTVIAKHNPGNSQQGWIVSYDSSTGFVTVTLHDAATGGAVQSRVSTVPIRVRSVFVFTFAGATSDLQLYVNGVSANGTNTGAVTNLSASTEPLAIGADSASTAASNIIKGGFYHASVWRVVLTSAEVATILHNGVTPAALKSAPYNLVANWEAAAISATPTSVYSAWIDTVASMNFLAVNSPLAQGPTGNLLVTNRWDTSLADTGTPGGQGLTSTYTLSGQFRIWGSALTQPQRATGYRQYKNDITIVLRARKVTGTTNAAFIRLYGLHLEYILSSKELFAFVGDDTSNTNQNRRFSFGFNLFPVEGTPADIVLRYNAADDNIDVFIGSTKYTATIATTNSNTTVTGLFLAGSSDFAAAAVVPACLSDAQVAQLIANIQSNSFLVYSADVFQLGEYVNVPYVPEETLSTLPDAIASAILPFDSTQQYSTDVVVELPYLDNPYPVVEITSFDFIDPLPAIVSFTVDSNHVVTAIGEAGPTDAKETYHYWEVEIAPGQIAALAVPAFSEAFFAGRGQVTDSFQLPLGTVWDGLRVRFVIQAVADATQLWYSAWQTLNDPNFDHLPPPPIPPLTTVSDPLPVIQSVTVNGLHEVTAVGRAGPTEATQVVHRWEIELTSGEVIVVIDETTETKFLVREDVTDTFSVPIGSHWNGKKIRFTVMSADSAGRHLPQSWSSAWFTLNDPNFDQPDQAPVVPPVWPGAVNPASDVDVIPAISIDLYKVTEHTLREASTLWPLGTATFIEKTIDVNTASTQSFGDLPAGLYRIKYADGYRYDPTSQKYNKYYPAVYGTNSHGLWIKSGVEAPYYVFQTPAFTTTGYTSGAAAETAALGYEFIFYHTGGNLGVIWDIIPDPGQPFLGSIGLELRDVEGMNIAGQWMVVSGTATIDDPTAMLPTVRNISPGITQLRYLVDGIDKKQRWQDVYLRMWNDQTTFPVQPKKSYPLDPTGSGRTLHERRNVKPPTDPSGNA